MSADNEATRREAEEERIAAENERIAAEGVRQAQEGAGDTEVSRVDAESERDLAEEERVRVSRSRREAEKERVVAEEGREDAEKNGREVAEIGRVEAEAERVQAEEKRSSVRLFYAKIAATVALPLAFISLIPAGIGIYLVHEETKQRCTDARLNRMAIRDTVLNSFAALGYRYDEKTGTAVEVGGELAYYKAHPEERARALESALKTVGRFPAISC